MPQFEFEREARTPHSESYAVEADGEAVGRVDVHFVPGGPAHATLCVPEEYDDEEIQELIGEVDERIVLTADAERADFIVTVWRGSSGGVYSEDEEDEEEETVGGNGRVS